MALAAWCVFRASGRVFGGLIGEGIIRGGERYRLRTSVISQSGDAECALWCVDTDGGWWAWSFEGDAKHWRRAPGLNPAGFFRQFYPDIPLDLHLLAVPLREMGFERITS